MQQYIMRRLMYGAVTTVLVSLFIFAIMRIAPGDVAMQIALDLVGGGEGGEEFVTVELLESIREELGLNKPLPVQYFVWLRDMVTLNWGSSMFSESSIWGEFTRKVPLTLELAIFSVILSTVLGIPVGIIMALRQDSVEDYVGRVFSLAGLSIPSFWGATMLIMIGIYFLSWSPRLTYVHIWDDPMANLSMFFWPAVITGYSSMATKARMMRSTMLEVLRQDYIRTANSKGLRYFVVVYRHAMKNALLPVLTIIGIQVSHILGGSVIMEQIFSLPGIGNYLIEGMGRRDYPVVQTLVMVFALWVVIINLVTDLMYGWLDPRIRLE